jgi:hypothetical protein
LCLRTFFSCCLLSQIGKGLRVLRPLLYFAPRPLIPNRILGQSGKKVRGTGKLCIAAHQQA